MRRKELTEWLKLGLTLFGCLLGSIAFAIPLYRLVMGETLCGYTDYYFSGCFGFSVNPIGTTIMAISFLLALLGMLLLPGLAVLYLFERYRNCRVNK